jgi:hypothetical protein
MGKDDMAGTKRDDGGMPIPGENEIGYRESQERTRRRRWEERGKKKEEIIASSDEGGTLQICKCGKGISDRWTDHRDKEGMRERRDGSERRADSCSVC